MKKAVIVVMSGALALQACGAHVQLPNTPDRTAPIQARVGAYNRLRPTAALTTQHLMVNRYGQVMSSSTSLDFISLADGSQVIYPEDLAPTVDANSVTVQAGMQSASARRTATGLSLGGLGGMLLATGLLIPGIGNAIGHTDYNTDTSTPGDGTLLYASIGVFVASTVLYFIGQFAFGSTASRERLRAFSTYDNSLRERLGLCGDGNAMGDCVNAGAPGAPPPVQ